MQRLTNVQRSAEDLGRRARSDRRRLDWAMVVVVAVSAGLLLLLAAVAYTLQVTP